MSDSTPSGEGVKRRLSSVETEVHVMLSYPHSNVRGQHANLTIRDARSGIEFVDIDLEPYELLAMLASVGDVGCTKATLRGLEVIGLEHSHESFAFGHEPTDDELAALEGDDWYVGTPSRNNAGKWIVIRRRWTPVPAAPSSPGQADQ